MKLERAEIEEPAGQDLVEVFPNEARLRGAWWCLVILYNAEHFSRVRGWKLLEAEETLKGAG